MSLDLTQKFERRVLILMALVQFINIWDFMIVMPMGPDFAKALNIDAGHIGWIAGSYSLAASFMGVASAKFLDRFDRKRVLLTGLCGLIVCTMSMVLASTLPQLILVRILTGMCGGPALASALAVIADVFPPQRRGEAMGKVFGSFSIASVFGVPLGLEIAQHFGWWAPFMAVSGVAVITLCFIAKFLPPMRKHMENAADKSSSLWRDVLHNPTAMLALLMNALGLFAAFMIIPNLSAHFQENMGYPRATLGLLYFCGGSAAFFTMRYAGKKSDKIGYAVTSGYSTLALVATLFVGFYLQTRVVPVLVIFILFMVTMSTRNVVANALLSRIPKADERAGFMSLSSAVQNLMAGLGAMTSTSILFETVDHHLGGIENVTQLAILCFAISALLMFRVERKMQH